MTELALANRAADWRRLKALVLDSVSSPIKKRVYNLGSTSYSRGTGRNRAAWFHWRRRNARKLVESSRKFHGSETRRQ